MKENSTTPSETTSFPPMALVAVIESIQDSFFQLDKNWNIVAVNKAFEHTSKLKRSDILDKTFWEVFPVAKDPKLKYWSAYHEVAEKKIPLFFDEYYEPLDIWTEVSAYPTEDGIAVFSRDINERKRRERIILDSEERLRLAIDTTKLGTWDFIPSTGKLTWSDECKKIYALPLDKEVDYAFFSDHIYPEDKHIAQGAIEKAMEASGTGEYDIEYRILRYSDRQVRWIRARGHVFFNLEMKPERFIGTVIDITDQKNTEQTLQYRKALLEAHNEASSDGILLVDAKGKIISYNQRFIDIWNMPPEITDNKDDEAALSFAMSQLEDPQQFIEKVRFLYDHPDEVSIDEILFKDGKIIERHGYPILGSDGSFFAWSWNFRNITERKQFEQTIRENEKKFRLITDVVPHMVWEIENDGTISYINKQWADWSGLTLEEINEGGWSKVFHPDDAMEVGKGWQHAFENGILYTGECRIKNPYDDEYSWFTLKTVPVKNDNDEITLWIGTATDIHEKKIAEQQKDQFISIASHELKTPVTSIKAFTQILEMKFLREGNIDAADLLSRMNRQIDKLTRLIIDLLDVTKIERGQLIFDEANFDFNDLVGEIVEEMQQTTQNHLIELIADETKIVYGDRNRIGQVITNLISNAIKYSPNADKIIVSTVASADHVKLFVRDFGIGIPEQQQQNIFTRFFRVTGKKLHTFPGLGLGLFISAEIVKRHGGSLTVESQEARTTEDPLRLEADHKYGRGGGSVFCCTLPAVPKE
ncbi:MAG: PAS domain S-box protein [Ginsengibacter sp.]